VVAQRRVEVPALHQLGHEEHGAGLEAGAVELDDVAVVELGQGLDLLEEELQVLAAGLLGLCGEWRGGCVVGVGDEGVGIFSGRVS